MRYSKATESAKFPFKVWITSVLASPLLYLLIIKVGGYRDQYAALFSGWGYY